MALDKRLHTKTISTSPRGFYEAEALGLEFLRETGGARVVEVAEYSESKLVLEFISSSTPNAQSAWNFGRMLALTHSKKEKYFGITPSKYSYYGPLDDPLNAVYKKTALYHDYVENRLKQMTDACLMRKKITRSEVLKIEDCVMSYLETAPEEFLNELPSRVHGDLWSGNLMWTTNSSGEVEGVLIDPAAHTGHREEDLAMLSLFGVQYFEKILEGYNSQYPLTSGFRARFDLHNIYPLLAHVAFYDRSYLSQVYSILEALSVR
ncbi:MAG: fructosamine kinase family protein [Candidatus Ancillula sp.]|jgi:fructosamine-3-kinase|nr:fructosamine kinase family protein [Candidatus Ancillula sp.]